MKTKTPAPGVPALTFQTNVMIPASAPGAMSTIITAGEPSPWHRIEDVPMLVWAFVHEFTEKMGKRIESVPKKTMDALQEYPWPGNVRELRNVIERAVILSPGDVLEVQVPRKKSAEPSRILTRKEMESRHILEVLECTGWRVKGPDGAAEKLGMKPTTLYSMMNRLGISRPPR